MRAALLCLALALVLAPASPSAISWSPALEQQHERLLKDVQEERWTNTQETPQKRDAALRLATFSAAMLTRLPHDSSDRQMSQLVQHLRQHITEVNRAKLDLDAVVSKTGSDAASSDAVLAAFKKYLSQQQTLAESLGMESARDLEWAPFAARSGDIRSKLENMWSATLPLLTPLTSHLQQRAADSGADYNSLVMGCVIDGDCAELVRMVLPYPTVSNAVSDLLRVKKLGSEDLAKLADSFLQRLGLPAAPSNLWQSSSFSNDDKCSSYVDEDKVRLCASGDMSGLLAALEVMTDSEYYRSVTSNQQGPFQAEAFPGFRRAVSECVALLALQPQSVHHLVYGYGADGAAAHPISLYLAQGARPSARPDQLCSDDIGCQMTANWLMETAVTQLLPLSYHVASVHWLEEVATSPAPFTAWQRHMHHTLGVSLTASPAQLDTSFYDNGRHIAAVLSTYAAFQLHAAACPTGARCVTEGDPGNTLKTVMEAGSSQSWDTLLTSVSGRPAPSADALVSFFMPVKRLTQPAAPAPVSLKTMELEDDEYVPRKVVRSHGAPAQVRAPTPSACDRIKDADKTEAEKILCDWSENSDLTVSAMYEDYWALGDDVTNGNDTRLVSDMIDYLMDKAYARSNLTKIDRSNWTKTNSTDELNLLVQMYILAEEKEAGQAPMDKLQLLLKSSTKMYTAYTSIMVCPADKHKCDDDEKISLWDMQQHYMSGELSVSDMLYYWNEYRSAAKSAMADTFKDYIKRGNDVAKEVGVKHYGELWLEPYDVSDGGALLQAMADTWSDLGDLYKQLHTYVRYQMKQEYPSEAPHADDPLPSHLLGDIFAENWVNIYNKTKFEDYDDFDITDALVQKKYSALAMAIDANTFHVNMGLEDFHEAPFFPSFGDNSDIDSDSCAPHEDCQPLAWNAGVGADIRLRAISTPNMDTYEAVHNRIAALEYYAEYMDLAPLYRAPTNPAFADAVAGAISLSVLNPDHLQALGLLDKDVNMTTVYHNFLYRRALQYLAPMPFDFVTQTWRWEVLNGTISSSNWEHRWWTLREDYQGVRPASRRHDYDFDPLAVPAIARDQPAFQRYLSTLMQFQLFEHFCIEAKQYDPKKKDSMLAKCNLAGYQSANLKTLMKVGKTKHWETVLAQYTENQTLSAGAMKRYFEPLSMHLQEFIKENNLKSGWRNNLGDYWGDADDDDNTVPIVVGVVLGVFVLIVLIAYFVVRVRRSKEE